EIAKMLTALSFEVKTEIRFIPNSERYAGVEPDVKAAVRVKRSDRRAARRRETTEDDRAGVPTDAKLEDGTLDDRPLRRFWRRGSSGSGSGSGGEGNNGTGGAGGGGDSGGNDPTEN